jgi:2'-hydroxyisoflavone reductase
MREVLEAAIAATGSDARLTWVPDEALQATEVEAWTEIPLWLPEAEAPGTFRVDTSRAEAAGLRCRPVTETVADVWAWLRAGGADVEGDGWLSDHAATGLHPEREREILAGLAR